MKTLETVQFTEGEKEVFRPRSGLTVSEWAEKYRIVTTGSMKGKWRNITTPYLKEPMDCFNVPYIRQIILMFAPQTGKTQVAFNSLLYSIDEDPGSAMYVLSTEKTAERMSKKRFLPMFLATAKIAEKMTDKKADKAKYHYRFKNGADLMISWATSASELASESVRYMFFDETDKYPQNLPGEGDPITLGEMRTKTFPYNSKIIYMSTPTTKSGFIYKLMTEVADEVRKYFVPCPHCGEYQLMEFDQIKWPSDVRDPRVIRREKLAWYECKHCGAIWDDIDRDRAVRKGKWISENPVDRPVAVGFHLPAWYSPFVSLSEVAAAFLKAHQDKTKMRAFVTQYKAEPYEEELGEREEKVIYDLRDERPRGLVPNVPVAAITASADTQDNGWYYAIRAWGYGRDMESWLIREGFVTTLDGLAKVFFEDVYEDVNGQKYVVNIALIDSGGHNTALVYDFCRFYPQALATKGSSHRSMVQPFRFSKVDVYPGTNKPIPGGVQLLIVNTIYYKDMLALKLQIAPGDPGAFHVHSEIGEDYAKQMVSEVKDEQTGLWKCPSGKDNHYWDCEVLNLVAADILGVRYEQRRDEEKKQEEEIKFKHIKNQRRRRW